jgi:hypothetical protein
LAEGYIHKVVVADAHVLMIGGINIVISRWLPGKNPGWNTGWMGFGD